MNTISAQGTDFVARHEGFVSKTYLDPVGIPTIGYGFTSRSPAVRRHLGKIRPGMTISRAKANQVLKAVIDEEFGVATNRGMPSAQQHEFDMGVSGSFNAGPRIFKWSWARLFRAGNVSAAAKRWSTTAVTAAGKRLPGLVRRRREEARLLEYGDYGKGKAAVFAQRKNVSRSFNAQLKGYQEKLSGLGYYNGEIDGLNGPQTSAAVLAFQKADPHLKDDGKLGPATMASIDRNLETRSTGYEAGGFGIWGILSTVSSFFSFIPTPLVYVGFGIMTLIGVYILWKYRKLIEVKIVEAIR